MNHFLFAGSQYYPNGGAEDLVGTYADVDDETVFAAVLKALQEDRIEYYHCLWANSLSIKPETLGQSRYWDVRIAKTQDDPSLQFCSVKQAVAELGWCGIVPLELSATRDDGSPSEDVALYARLDPKKQTIRWLT